MLREEIVQLLRDRFCRGATPSKLIRIIMECHDTAITNPCVIQDYLDAAFHIPPLPCFKSADDYSTDGTLRHSVLNRILLPELVAYCTTWNGQAGREGPLHGSWLDGLKTISPEEAKATEQAKPHHGISDEGWSRLVHDPRQHPTPKRRRALRSRRRWQCPR